MVQIPRYGKIVAVKEKCRLGRIYRKQGGIRGISRDHVVVVAVVPAPFFIPARTLAFACGVAGTLRRTTRMPPSFRVSLLPCMI